MEILYFTYIGGDAFEADYRKLHNYPYSVSARHYQKEYVRGFSMNGNNVTTVSLIPYKWCESGHLYYNRTPETFNEGTVVNYLSFFNIPVLQEISRLFSAMRAISKWAKKTKGKKRVVLIVLNNYTPVMLGAMLACKLRRIHISTHIHDNLVDLYSKEYIAQISALKKLILPIYLRFAGWIESKYDSYIFIASGMNEVINKRNRPHITVEGIYSISSVQLISEQKKKNAIMYAGSLHSNYGIKMILQVFSQIEDSQLELWICGTGECENLIKERAELDPRIHFLGYIDRQKVLELETQAKLLVNMRDPSLGYTRRSFPSKMLEYMLSGTPMLTTKLQGIPDEYYSYVYYTDSYSIHDIKEEVVRILNQDDASLQVFALKARSFVMKRASADVQAKRISSFFEEIV